MHYRHVAFSTVPWRNADEFNAARKCRDDYWKKSPRCIKSESDYAAFADHYDSLQALGTKKSKYLKKQQGPLNRLSRDLCRAFKQGEAGLVAAYQRLTANQFAKILNEAGLKVSRADVENGKRSAFQSSTTPPTAAVLEVLARLEEHLPELDRDCILSAPAQAGVLLMPALDRHCSFIERLQ